MRKAVKRKLSLYQLITNMATFKMSNVHVARTTFYFFLCFLNIFAEEGRHTRFEYKHSFKGPHLVNKQGHIPFWNYYGSKIAIYLSSSYILFVLLLDLLSNRIIAI